MELADPIRSPSLPIFVNRILTRFATLELLGILPTRFTRTVHAREVIDRTKEEVGRECHIFEHPIHESVRFAEATGQGTTVFDIAPDIEGARAYQAIAKEIVHA
jgi:chromosome partitioning protein